MSEGSVEIQLERYGEELPSCRWFRGKQGSLANLTLADSLPTGPGSAWLLLEATHEDGTREVYHLPAVTTGEGSLDGIEGEDLLTFLRRGFSSGEIRTSGGCSISFRGSLPGAASAVSVLSTTTSNTLLRAGGLLIKVYRQPPFGVNPDVELGEYLSENSFPHAPYVYGSVRYKGRMGEGRDLLLVSHLLSGAEGVWDLFVRNAGASAGEIDAVTREIGRVTARLHEMLCSGDDAPFVPEAPDRRAFDGLRARLLRDGDGALDLLRKHHDMLDLTGKNLAQEVLGRADRLRAILSGPWESRAPWIRIHGNLHLAQLVQVKGRIVITDFEGDVMRPLAERRRYRPASMDVASMVRSFEYAARARGVPLEWADSLSKTFLQAYWSESSPAPHFPGDPEVFTHEVALFALDRACYELRYEIQNRPDWAWIPLTGILEAMERIEAGPVWAEACRMGELER